MSASIPSSAGPTVSRAEALSLGAAIAMGCAAGLGFGITMPLVSLNLDDLGLSDTAIGLFLSALAAIALVASPFTPRLAGWLGASRLLMISGAGYVLTFVLYALAETWPVWLAVSALRLLVSMVMFNLSEAWVAERAPARWRGRVMGLYASAQAGSIAAGAAIPVLAGHTSLTPLIIGAAMGAFALACAALAPLPPTTPAAKDARATALISRFRDAPAVFLGVLTLGAIEMSMVNFAPIYGRDTFAPLFPDDPAQGLRIGGGVLVAVTAGMVLLQPLLGWLADKVGARRVLWLCAVSSLAGPWAMIAAGSDWPLVYAGAFVTGGASVGLWVMGLSLVSERYRGGEIVAANALMIFLYNAGAAAGPLGAGFMGDAFGPWGLIAAPGLYAGLYCLVLFASLLTRRRL